MSEFNPNQGNEFESDDALWQIVRTAQSTARQETGSDIVDLTDNLGVVLFDAKPDEILIRVLRTTTPEGEVRPVLVVHDKVCTLNNERGAPKLLFEIDISSHAVYNVDPIAAAVVLGNSKLHPTLATVGQAIAEVPSDIVSRESLKRRKVIESLQELELAQQFGAEIDSIPFPLLCDLLAAIEQEPSPALLEGMQRSGLWQFATDGRPANVWEVPYSVQFQPWTPAEARAKEELQGLSELGIGRLERVKQIFRDGSQPFEGDNCMLSLYDVGRKIHYGTSMVQIGRPSDFVDDMLHDELNRINTAHQIQAEADLVQSSPTGFNAYESASELLRAQSQLSGDRIVYVPNDAAPNAETLLKDAIRLSTEQGSRNARTGQMYVKRMPPGRILPIYDYQGLDLQSYSFLADETSDRFH